MKWWCPNCGYIQTFEMTEEAAKRHFPEIPNLKAGECPSCRRGQLEDYSLYEVEVARDNQIVRAVGRIMSDYVAQKTTRGKALAEVEKLLLDRERGMGKDTAEIREARQTLVLQVFDAWEKRKDGVIDEAELGNRCGMVIKGIKDVWEVPWQKRGIDGKDKSAT